MKRNFVLAVAAVMGAAVFVFGDVGDALAQTTREFWDNRVRYGNQYRGPNQFYLRAGAIAVSGFLGFALGWFLSPQAAPLRKLIGISVGVLLVLITIVDNGWLGWGLTSFTSIAAFCIGFGYWMRGTWQRFRDVPKTFGSARWANFQELMRRGLITFEGVRLGYFYDGEGVRHPLSYNGDWNISTFAPNRSGKGTCMIVPNLLTYEGSVLVIDPKGENTRITAKHRKQLGQSVFVVDPYMITGEEPACFNPIDWLQPGDVDMTDNAILLADAIIMMTGGEAQFWDEESKALLIGVMIYVATDKQEEGQRHLGRVRDLLLLDGENLNKLFKRMLRSPYHVVRSTGARGLQKEERLLANVLASLQAQTHFLDSPRIRECLSRSDFSFEDLKSKRMSVYLVLPSDKLTSHGRFLRLLLQQAITVTARNYETRPDKSVKFILDEMPALGKLTMVKESFGLLAGYGMQMHVICQSASQLKDIYGDGWETFISNSGVVQYFGSPDQFTSEYFSTLCGVTTVWDWSSATARAIGVSRGKDTSHSETTTSTDTTSAKQRQLAYPDELKRLPSHLQLLLVENMNPIIAEKQPWFENPELRDLGVNLYEQEDESDHSPSDIDVKDVRVLDMAEAVKKL